MNNSIKYPSEEECFLIIRNSGMFPNIVDHSIQVKNVSVAIYNNLVDQTLINKDLLIAAALLHDIAKTHAIIHKEMRHDLLGGQMLRRMGFDTIADIVENHVIFADYSREMPLSEKEIVYYADKRVMHDKIVSVDERVADLVERYGITDKAKELILKNKSFILELEEKIQSYMHNDIETALKRL